MPIAIQQAPRRASRAPIKPATVASAVRPTIAAGFAKPAAGDANRRRASLQAIPANRGLDRPFWRLDRPFIKCARR
jgi:hypothetical protein